MYIGFSDWSRYPLGNYTMTINPDGRYKDGYIEADAVGSVLDDYATSGVCQQTSHFASSNIAGPQPANPDFPFVGVYIKVDPTDASSPEDRSKPKALARRIKPRYACCDGHSRERQPPHRAGRARRP